MLAKQVGESKGWVDIGGQWIGREHTTVRTLAKELGLELFEHHKSGPTVFRYHGRRYIDENPTAAPSAQDRKAAEDLLDALSRTADLAVPNPSQPWASPQAPAYDRQSLGQWIDENSDNDYARFYAGMTTVFDQAGASPYEVSLLHSLFERKASPSDAEPEKFLIKGAAGHIPPLLAARLGGDNLVRLDSKAVSIHQSSNGVTIGAVTPRGYEEHSGKAVIVAIPPWLAGGISYTSSIPRHPGLPARRMSLTQRMAMGTIAIVASVYETPWWRASGEKLSGTSFSADELIGWGSDTSLPGDEGPGVLTSFIQGDKLFEWIGLSQEDRKEWVLRDLADLFGKAAERATDYAEGLWPQDQLTGGGYNSYLPPGGWSSFGSAIREPFGRISWAGTETANKWYGYIEGAAIAGERAAEEILNNWL